MNLTAKAFSIAALASDRNIIYLADDEQQAETVAAILDGLLPSGTVMFVPSSDALPGDSAPASPANSGRRVAALRRLRAAQAGKSQAPLALVLSGEAASRRYPPPESFDSAPPTLRMGDEIETGKFSELVSSLGYFHDDRIDEPGEVSIRGDVIDIFPADAGSPARIEHAEGRIVSIRVYDPVSQRSKLELESLEIGRAAEPPVEQAVSILDHLRPGDIVFGEKADRRRQRYLGLAADAAERGKREVDALGEKQWSAALAPWRLIELETEAQGIPRFAEARSPATALTRFIKPKLKTHAFILAGSERDLRFLRPRLAKKLALEIGGAASLADLTALKEGDVAAIELPVDEGFIDGERVVIAAADVLGSRALVDAAPSLAADPWTSVGCEVRVGDIVIHEDHGIGRVVGLEPSPAGQSGQGELIALEYAGGARRLVPIDEADRIWRYGADADAVTLDKLDGSSWQKRRRSIQDAIDESAKGLAELAAARARLTAPVVEPDPVLYERFVNGFEFNETADQARAINAVRDDLASGKPMDRLVVGDVGYGKTEVALRAAALTALAGFQVIVAAPTTVLVRQHLENFRRRFEGSGIVVEGLSRLSSAADKKRVKAGIADGSIHVVVGTGAVAGKGLDYQSLGLVVIDEEQRFGTADKARLRGSGEVHLLSLSATPIPRTLQMAMVGLQKISIIATPPARRQPIRTSLDTFDDIRVRTALMREKGRGGQSFVVVPRIEDMEGLAKRISRIVPDLSLLQAHGKMPAADIDDVMVRFADGEGDILLATNIIEAGLDVPRANTMIVWRADRFGLAQLHQLRGRVGRGNRRGQVILLTSSDDKIGERTLKRLRTLATFDRLGAGFDISARDLDMRGAGDLLGDDQAGHMRLIGTELYQHLLGTALRQARGETVEHWSPELNLGEGGSFPESWVPELDLRLELYVRLARMKAETELDAFEEELVDRFGPLPEAAERLVGWARVRLAAKLLQVERIDAGPAAIAITPRKGFEADVGKIGLEKKDGRLLLREKTLEAARFERVQTLLNALGG